MKRVNFTKIRVRPLNFLHCHGPCPIIAFPRTSQGKVLHGTCQTCHRKFCKPIRQQHANSDIARVKECSRGVRKKSPSHFSTFFPTPRKKTRQFPEGKLKIVSLSTTAKFHLALDGSSFLQYEKRFRTRRILKKNYFNLT